MGGLCFNYVGLGVSRVMCAKNVREGWGVTQKFLLGGVAHLWILYLKSEKSLVSYVVWCVSCAVCSETILIKHLTNGIRCVIL